MSEPELQEVFHNPIITDTDGADHGDPFVMKYMDKYYLYHTGRKGIRLYISSDMVHWEFQGDCLKAIDDRDHWAQIDLWAPEVMYFEGTFYMYVTGTKVLPNGRGDDFARRLGIARSRTPEGPFVWDANPLVPWEWSIDGHPYRNADGSLWLYYNIRTEASRYHDGTTGCGNVVDQLLAPDQLEGVQDVVSYPTERWEGNAEGTWYWNEGPAVLKRHDVYYQMYSGGCYRDGTYAVGYATAPTPRGPWTKYPGNPILHSKQGILGPGHHCIVNAPDGVTPYIIYHGYLPGEKGRKDHTDRLFWVGDKLVLEGPTVGDQPMPPGAVYDVAVPHWHIDAWVRASHVQVANTQVGLTPGNWHHVQAAFCNQQLTIDVDAIRKYVGAATDVGPELKADGDVQSVAVTSALDDEKVYELSAGQEQRWQWGGTTPVEVSLAIQGVAEVRMSGSEVKTVAVNSPDSYQHVRCLLPKSVEYIEVQAGAQGAKVTDMVLIARKG